MDVLINAGRALLRVPIPSFIQPMFIEHLICAQNFAGLQGSEEER